jgi:hypothetical protein
MPKRPDLAQSAQRHKRPGLAQSQERDPVSLTVAAFINALPADRRKEVERVRQVIKKHLPAGYVEAVTKGMIVYEVPLAAYSDTFNGHALWYVALASERSYLSLHLMPVYGSPVLAKKLGDGFSASGKKLDMGKACIHFQRADDLALDTVGEIVAAVPMEKWIAIAEGARKRPGLAQSPAGQKRPGLVQSKKRDPVSLTPLAQKLGIKAGMTVAVIGGPKTYSDLVAPVPEGVTIVTKPSISAGLTHIFSTKRAHLVTSIVSAMAAMAPAAAIWVSWPKRASKVSTDITEDTIREVALPLGLVDIKVCAVDATWSGLKLARRKATKR